MHYIKHYFQSLIIAWWNNLVCLVGHCIVLILSELLFILNLMLDIQFVDSCHPEHILCLQDYDTISFFID